jgi:hypothetical protein
MDIAHERVRLHSLLAKVSSGRTRTAYLTHFDQLATAHADPNTPATERALVEAKIEQMLRNAEMSSHGGVWSVATGAFAALIVLLFFGGVALYMSALEEPISSVRATRPILVFTLIVAMLGFGGLLMVRSLFGAEQAEEHLERRFRLAREIFLVYAGIFGTIIGFYFGAADEGGLERPPAVTVAIRDQTMTAQVTGGAPPFVAYLSREDPPLNLLLEGNERLLTLNMDEPANDPLEQCPLGGTVTVIDGQGRRASADVLPESIVGWDKCKNMNQSPAEGEAGKAQGPGG